MSELTPSISVDRLPEQFFIDLAVGVHTFEDICAIYSVDPEAVEDVESDDLFVQRFNLAKQAVEDSGEAFRARCRTIVHRALPLMETLMGDPDAPATARLDAFKSLVKYGELEPAKQETTDRAGPQFVLNIIAPDGTTAFEQQVVATQTSASEPLQPAELPILDGDIAKAEGF